MMLIRFPINKQLKCFTINLNSWASSIRNTSSPQQALYLYAQMQYQGLPFDSYSILFTLKSCTHLQNLTLINHLHTHIYKLGFRSHVYVATSLLYAYVVSSFEDCCKLFDEMPERNTVTWNTMITGYFKSGGVEKAKRVFQEMPVKDVKSWSSMVAGFMGSGKWEEGLMVFREMMVKEVFRPDEVMLGSVFSGCACMGSLGLLAGKSSHGFVAKNGWELNVELGTVLIDMYAKCGLLKSAVRVFERMSARNVMSWSAMICGLAQHGCGEEALLMFKKMKGSGVRPNEITFTGILSACTHSGLVEEGLKNYEEMIEHYRLEPRIQHYGCIVDLLGKAGRLEEAYGIVKTMKLEPNVIVWSSLLVACRLHKQFDIGERVIEQVLKVVKPERDGGVYGLVSDLYASSGKWDYALRVREMMVSQNVKKVRGSSVVRS